MTISRCRTVELAGVAGLAKSCTKDETPVCNAAPKSGPAVRERWLARSRDPVDEQVLRGPWPGNEEDVEAETHRVEGYGKCQHHQRAPHGRKPNLPRPASNGCVFAVKLAIGLALSVTVNAHRA